MANVILRGLAIAAGTGLAMGLTSGRTRTMSGPRAVRYRPAVALPPAPEPLALTSRDEILDIEPLLDRVERLEDLVDGMKRSPTAVPADFAAAVANLERRIDEQTRDLELLREQVEKAERRAMESVAAEMVKASETLTGSERDAEERPPADEPPVEEVPSTPALHEPLDSPAAAAAAGAATVVPLRATEP